MSLSALTVTIQKSWFDASYNVLGTVAVGASPGTYATGGLILNLGIDPLVKAQRLPLVVFFASQNGYVYSYVPGATLALGKLKISTTAATELAAAATPSGVSGDTIQFLAMWAGML